MANCASNVQWRNNDVREESVGTLAQVIQLLPIDGKHFVPVRNRCHSDVQFQLVLDKLTGYKPKSADGFTYKLENIIK